MQQLSPSEIKDKAYELQKSGKKWHFHILTPACQLHDSSKFALVLENTSDKENHVAYTDEPAMEIGKALVEILHGGEITKSNKTEGKLSDQVQRIIERAKELNAAGKHWHHHMLFPDCLYNKHQGRWTIIFEDTDTKEIIESVYDSEPKSDLQAIEAIYYQQKTLS